MPLIATFLSLQAALIAGPGSTASLTQNLTPRTQVPAEQYFEVSRDGSRTYTTIQAALQDATDPKARKVIQVYPGTYTLNSEEQIEVTINNTHIIGQSKESVYVKGNMQLGYLAGATINIKADNCSVQNMTISNKAKLTDIENYKATALMVNVGSDNFRGNNLKLYSYTDPTVHEGWGYDCFWCHGDATDCLLQNCEFYAYSDIISVSGELTITDSTIHVMVKKGGYAFWVGQSRGFGRAFLTAVNIETRGCRWPYGYLVFGENGNADVRLTNVSETEYVATPPAYYAAATNAKSWIMLSNTFGRLPKNPKNVSTIFLVHDPKKASGKSPATQLRGTAVE